MRTYIEHSYNSGLITIFLNLLKCLAVRNAKKEKFICLQKTEIEDDFYQRGVTFGKFLQLMADFPSERLHELMILQEKHCVLLTWIQ